MAQRSFNEKYCNYINNFCDVNNKCMTSNDSGSLFSSSQSDPNSNFNQNYCHSSYSSGNDNNDHNNNVKNDNNFDNKTNDFMIFENGDDYSYLTDIKLLSNENEDCLDNDNDNDNDNASECNSIGNATFVCIPTAFSNNNEKLLNSDRLYYDILVTNDDNDSVLNFGIHNDENSQHNKNQLSFIDSHNNHNTKMNSEYTLQKILNNNELLYHATNVEGSKLIQWLLMTINNISNTTCELFNKQLLSKIKNESCHYEDTMGMILCQNVYGNYVVQRYLSTVPFQYRHEIICRMICPNAYRLIFDKYGYRVLQYVVSRSSTNFNCNKLLDYTYYILYNVILNHDINELIENIGSSQLVQNCITFLIDNNNNNCDNINTLFDLILKQIQDKLYDFSANKSGCRIIQKFLDFGNTQQKKSDYFQFSSSFIAFVLSQIW